MVDLGRTVEQAKWISIDHALTISNPKRIRSSEPKKKTKKPNVEQRNRSGQIRLVTCNWLGMSVFLWLVSEPNVNSVSFIYQRFSVVNFRMPFISFVCWSLSLILKSALIDNDLAINIVYVLSLIDGAFQLDRLCVFTFSQALNLIRFNTLHLQPILPCLFFSTSFHQYSPDRHFIPIFFPFICCGCGHKLFVSIQSWCLFFSYERAFVHFRLSLLLSIRSIDIIYWVINLFFWMFFFHFFGWNSVCDRNSYIQKQPPITRCLTAISFFFIQRWLFADIW